MNRENFKNFNKTYVRQKEKIIQETSSIKIDLKWLFISDKTDKFYFVELPLFMIIRICFSLSKYLKWMDVYFQMSYLLLMHYLFYESFAEKEKTINCQEKNWFFK
jgi:hypothetical protein